MTKLETRIFSLDETDYGYAKGEVTFNNVLDIYRQDRNGAIAFVYGKLAPRLLHVFNRYYWTSKEDRSSTLMMSIDKALNNFSEDKQCSLKTYITVCYRNALLSERTFISAKTKGRDWYLNVSSIDSLLSDTMQESIIWDTGAVVTIDPYDSLCGVTKDETVDRFEMFEETFLVSLTDNQFRYLQLVMDSKFETVRDAEAARVLGISRAGIKAVKNSLAKKLKENGIV